MTDRHLADDDGCPGPARCPLYILAHDASVAHLGCVRDMAEQCEGSAGPEQFDALFDRAHATIFSGLRARLGVRE